jgi:hypothetical protein
MRRLLQIVTHLRVREFCSLIRATEWRKMSAMLLGSFGEINLEIMTATLQAFSKRGFCGDLSFTLKFRQPFRVVTEVHHGKANIPSDWHAIVEEAAPIVRQWLELPETVLTVRFDQGKINKILIRDSHSGLVAERD